MGYSKEIKVIRHLQHTVTTIEQTHEHLGLEINTLKARLAQLTERQDLTTVSALAAREKRQAPELNQGTDLDYTAFKDILVEADHAAPGPVSLSEILTVEDWQRTEGNINGWVADFNRKNSLEAWDYALGGTCGLFAGLLDVFCVRAPVRSSRTSFDTPLDGVFNRGCQKAFNAIFPPEYSKELSAAFTIGAPDASTRRLLLDQPTQAFGPQSHRFRSLAHDPILGFFFGVRDMLNNTCTVVDGGCIVSLASGQAPVGVQGIFQGLGRMLGHLASDFNAPTAKGNRGMGLPAPFMGLLAMFDIPLPDSAFGKMMTDVQGVQGMYLRGYDLRHFIVTSIPLAIMEVLLRTAYAVKQVKLHGMDFFEALKETVPGTMSPRFRMITTLAYGTFCAVNAGKVAVTNNMLNANYAAWMGLCWNSFHSLKWAVCDRHFALWQHVEASALAELEATILKIEELEQRARLLPTFKS